MLSLLSHTADTNMIARGGAARLAEIREQISRMLAESPYPAKAAVAALENLSPGGSADQLSLCWMLHFLKEAGE